jgi:hypothetical protein
MKRGLYLPRMAQWEPESRLEGFREVEPREGFLTVTRLQEASRHNSPPANPAQCLGFGASSATSRLTPMLGRYFLR